MRGAKGASVVSDQKKFSSYTIDAQDLIAGVNGSWQEFADSNGATNIDGDQVVGHSVWDYIAGTEVRKLYEMLFGEVRKNRRAVSVPCRCDAPDCRRFMELRVAPGTTDGALAVTCVTVREEQRAGAGLFTETDPDPDKLLKICSWCNHVEVDDDWVEVEEATQRLNFFGAQRLPRLTHGICPQCADLVREQLSPED